MYVRLAFFAVARSLRARSNSRWKFWQWVIPPLKLLNEMKDVSGEKERTVLFES
jgi:hypothetical protein